MLLARRAFPRASSQFATEEGLIQMLGALLGWIGMALVWASPLQAAGQEVASRAPATASSNRVLLDRYCVTCHNEKLKTAELILSKMSIEDVGSDPEVWEKVVRKLRGGVMPPAGAPRPDKLAYDSLATYLETELDRAAATGPNPGRTSVHRLNRAEYANAIRDLLAVEIDSASLLPPDDSSYGFDNIGAALSISPSLMERYMSAARKISRLAIGSPMARPDFKRYAVSSFLTQDDRMSEELPLGSRGGIAIRHHFPLDGDYIIRIRLRRNGEIVVGLGQPHQIDVRLDGERVTLLPVGGKPEGDSEETDSQADAALEVRIPVKAGARLVGVTFLNVISDPEGVLRAGRGADAPALDSITIEGPYDAKGPGDTPSRRRIFLCRPINIQEDEACAKKIFSTLAHRAYRRPILDEDVRDLITFYNSVRRNASFEAAIEMTLRGLLVTPAFLFQIERDPPSVAPGTAYFINDVELASRLSFFLWSSIPDDELLDLAERGNLKDPTVLEQQVRRMLADPRSKALVSNFAGQWLLLRNLRVSFPDLQEFPSFDDDLRYAFQQETELFFETLLREDRSVLDLLDGEYTFLNERLARHYGIPNIFGSHFRRVKLTDENRRGLLGKASILTVTSYPARTSPVLRGKWLLENILGTPPAPPPPDVPALKDRDDEGKILSVRQLIEQHRANPVCAGCHAQMDPLGFALENFDAIGQWRNTSGADNTPIDSSGMLPDGTKFQGPTQLRRMLLGKPGQFVGTVTERLLTYALGRGVEYYDVPAVRKILREAAPTDYRWSSLILGIVNSTPFQMRTSAELPSTIADGRQ